MTREGNKKDGTGKQSQVSLPAGDTILHTRNPKVSSGK